MLLLIALILLVLILFGAGFTVHLLWWLAVIALIAAVLSLFIRR